MGGRNQKGEVRMIMTRHEQDRKKSKWPREKESRKETPYFVNGPNRMVSGHVESKGHIISSTGATISAVPTKFWNLHKGVRLSLDFILMPAV